MRTGAAVASPRFGVAGGEGPSARGAAERFRADASVSVTGLAGPGGGTDEIPVGRVYIGTFFRGSVFVSEFTFSGDRAEIRRAAAAAALDRLLTAVSGQDL